MEIFDTHTHLNSDEFKGREADVVAQAAELAVTQMNIAGVDRQTNDWALALAERFESCYATIGWHPDEAADFDQTAEDYLLKHLEDPKVLALGEIGLDYHWMVRPKTEQARVFRRQIQLAKAAGKPFQVHTRDALADTYDILADEGVGPAGAIMHSFSGTYEEALRFVKLGMMLSFSGVVTFKNARDVQEAARRLPLETLLVETDAPYLTPAPYRGRDNQPAYTRYVVEKIAELRDLSPDEVAAATTTNARRIFGIDE